MPDHVDTDDCQAQVFSPELPANNTCQAISNIELSKLEQQAQQEHACLGRQAPVRHETGLMVQAEQQLLRRAVVALQVRRVGEKKINQIQRSVVRLITFVKEQCVMSCRPLVRRTPTTSGADR